MDAALKISSLFYSGAAPGCGHHHSFPLCHFPMLTSSSHPLLFFLTRSRVLLGNFLPHLYAAKINRLLCPDENLDSDSNFYRSVVELVDSYSFYYKKYRLRMRQQPINL
jgi:hypothetical protein